VVPVDHEGGDHPEQKFDVDGAEKYTSNPAKGPPRLLRRMMAAIHARINAKGLPNQTHPEYCAKD
jgi:hypothetical protein